MLPTLNHPNASISNVRHYFRDYCNSTSIHGFRYFGEKRTFAERIWWLIIFVICLSGCAYFIFLIYNKWENSPVVISVSTKQTSISEIPFPAVTICPETKSKKHLYNHTATMLKGHHQNLTLKEYKQFSYMSLICDLIYYIEQTTETFDNYVYSDNEFFDFLYSVNPEPDENVFADCYWMNTFYHCDDLWKPVITDEGICYTFNMLENSDIYKDNVLLPDIPFTKDDIDNESRKSLNTDETYPRKTRFSGAKNALFIILQEKYENIDHLCKSSIQGFKVTLHSPTTVPMPRQQFFRVQLNQIVTAAVHPDMILTSDSVKEFKPEKRDCYFENERPLNFFQHYNQHNCMLECLTNFTLYWCDCVKFFMPRVNGTGICGFYSKACTDEAEDFFQAKHPELESIDYKRTQSAFNNKVNDCDCLPLCSDISYNIESSSLQFDWMNIDKALYPEMDLSQQNLSFSQLIIYFKNPQFLTSQRHELYGPTDFLGNFGGLLGLFTGFSILSLMEMVYFLTVRIMCNIKLYGHWSGKEK